MNWFWSGEKISKVLSKREKALIILLLLLTILYTYYTWILSPLLRKIDLLNREKHDLLAQVAELQKSTPDKILDNSVEEEQLLTLWQQVPATSAIPEAISNLQKMAEESGVVLHRIYFKKLSEAGQETFKMGELQEEEIEIRAVGGADSDVVITAASASEGTVNAGAAIKNTGEEAKVGFGASVVINIISNSVKAYIADGIALSGAISDVILGAELESQTEAKAESGAGSTSATSINGAVALNVSISSVEAYLGISSEALNAGGDVTVSARNINQVSGEASGVAAGSKVGIGIALVINVVTDKTLATTKRNIRADGSVSFKAEGASGSSTTAKAGTNGGEEEKEEDDEGGSDGNADTSGIDEKINKLLGFLNKTSEEKGIEKKASDGDEGKIPEKTPQKAETSEGGVNVAGALAVNIVSSSIEAYIPTGIVIISGGKLTIKASSNTDAEAKADGSAVKADKNSPAKVGVGVAVAINVANTKTLAYIESGATVTAGGLYIAAIMTELPAEESGSDPDVTNEYTAEAVSGAGSGKIGVAGSVALNIVNSETAAYTASQRASGV